MRATFLGRSLLVFSSIISIVFSASCPRALEPSITSSQVLVTQKLRQLPSDTLGFPTRSHSPKKTGSDPANPHTAAFVVRDEDYPVEHGLPTYVFRNPIAPRDRSSNMEGSIPSSYGTGTVSGVHLDSGKLSTSDKVALGLGIRIGLPATLSSITMCFLRLRNAGLCGMGTRNAQTDEEEAD